MQEEKKQALSKDILKRYTQLAQVRKPYEEVWEQIGQYVLPKRVNPDINESRRAERSLQVYNGTAISALDLMVNGLLGYLVSRVTKWMKLYHEKNEYMRYPEARQYFEEVEEGMYGEFNRSNFYDVITEVFKDGGGMGTACVHIEEDIYNSRVNYSARPPKEMFIAENRYGYVDTVFRHYFMTTKQLIEAFDKEGLTEQFKNENKEQLYKKHKVIHAVYPRANRDVSRMDNQNKMFASVYILEAGGIVLRESGIDTLNDVVWRWDKNTDEEYGRSPAWIALPEILRINKISKDLLKLGDYTVNPAVQYPGSMEYKLSLNPHGRNPYNRPDELIQPIKLGEYPIGRDREERIEAAIRDAFHVDFFLGLQQVSKVMTIPEIMERQGEKAAVLGTSVGRINSELLDPLIEKTFEIAHRAGRMPEVPEILQEEGGEVKIEYIGPLAQILKRNFASQGITRAMEQIMPLAQMNPEIMDYINFDEMAKELMISGGMPQRIIRDDREVFQLRQQRAAQMQQQQQMQQIEAMGKAAPGLNVKPEDDSLLAGLNEQLAGAVDGRA